MTDRKSVVQEVQKELLAVMQRGQEQVRKSQDRVRKSQEQARKSRDAVVSVVRAGGEFAKAVRPNGSTLPTVHIPSPAAMRAHAQELAGHAVSAQRGLATRAFQAASPYTQRVLTAQRELADRARQAGVAEQVAAAQRTLAGRLSEVARVATPLVAESRTRLTQIVSALQPGHPAADDTAHEVSSASSATVEQPAAPEAQTPAKPKGTTSKASAAKTSAAKSTTTKTTAAKSTTAKTSAAKSTTVKASTRQAAGSKPSSTPKK